MKRWIVRAGLGWVGVFMLGLTGCGEPAQPAGGDSAAAGQPAAAPGNTAQLRSFIQEIVDRIDRKDGAWMATRMFVPAERKGTPEKFTAEITRMLDHPEMQAMRRGLKAAVDAPWTLQEDERQHRFTVAPEKAGGSAHYLWFFKLGGQWYMSGSSGEKVAFPAETADPDLPDVPQAKPAPAASAAQADELPGFTGSPEEQAFAYCQLLRKKLEAREYEWIYNNVFPPATAKAYHAGKPLAEFIREFADKGEDKILLEALKTVDEVDCEVDAADANRVTIRWKDSWKKHNNLVFVKVDGHWYLGH